MLNEVPIHMLCMITYFTLKVRLNITLEKYLGKGTSKKLRPEIYCDKTQFQYGYI